MAFGKLGAMGRGFGTLGALGRVSGVAGLPSLVASKAAADSNNPQINGTYGTPPTISYQTSAFTGLTVAYPSTFTIAAHMAAYQYEGGLPFSIGGKVFLYNQSVGGSGSRWPSYTAKIDDGAGSAGTIMTVTTVNWGVLRVGHTVSGATGGTTIVNQLTGPTGGVGTYTVSTSQLLASSPLTSGATSITAAGVERRTIIHTGSAFSFSFNDNTTPYYWRLIVSDASNGNKPQYTDRVNGYATPGAGGTQFAKVDFGSSATRTITIEFPGAVGFLAFQQAAGGNMSKPADTPNPRIHFLADSIGGPINNPTTGVYATNYTASATAGVMTVSAIGIGNITVGQTVQTAGQTNTTIASFGTGTGQLGTYNLTNATEAFGSQKVYDGSAFFAGDSIDRRLADLLGAKATIDQIGGTGWNVPTAGGTTTVINRVVNSEEYLAMVSSHDLFVVNMAINDVSAINGGAQTFAANTAAMQTAVNSIAAIAAANPTKIWVITGGWYKAGAVGGYPSNPPTAGSINLTYEAAIQSAVASAKAANPGARIVYMQVQDIFWGNVPTGINADLTHPTTAGEVLAPPIYRDRLMTAVASV
jgi:hypothetical protein